MVDFFGDWELNKWWKRNLAKHGYTNVNYGFSKGYCAICGREDIVFPSGELKVCDRCYMRMKDNGAVINTHSIGVNLSGQYCDVCGEKMYKYHIVNTYICNRCTKYLGKIAKENRDKTILKFNARRII